MEVNTVSISDGITMGTEGMKASLVSRELITDSIELCGVGYAFRRGGGDLRLRQDDSGGGDGDGAAEHSGGGAVQRLDCAGASPRRA